MENSEKCSLKKNFYVTGAFISRFAKHFNIRNLSDINPTFSRGNFALEAITHDSMGMEN